MFSKNTAFITIPKNLSWEQPTTKHVFMFFCSQKQKKKKVSKHSLKLLNFSTHPILYIHFHIQLPHQCKRKIMNIPALLLNVLRTIKFSNFFTHPILDSIPENSMYASSSTTKIGSSRIFKRISSLIILQSKKQDGNKILQDRI